MHVLQSRVLLRPTDMGASIHFYEEQLGLARYREWGDPPHRGIVYFTGGSYLELLETSQGQRPSGLRLWFQVADVAATWRALQEADVQIIASPQPRPWGLIEMEIIDPDGLVIVVVEIPLDHPLRRDQRGRGN